MTKKECIIAAQYMTQKSVMYMEMLVEPNCLFGSIIEKFQLIF